MNAHVGRGQSSISDSAGMRMTFDNAEITAGRDIASNNIINNTIVYSHGELDEPKFPIKIAEWLRQPSINYKSIQEETRALRTPDTIRWFFDLQEYIRWVDDEAEGHRNLRCIGMPGAGKTVLASAVIEDLERRSREQSGSKRRIVLYLYFKHDRQSIQTKAIVLANLLSQLVQIQDPPSDSVLQFYKEYEQDYSLAPGLDRTMTMLRSEIAANTMTYIVIDALDEFTPKDFSSALSLVRELEGLDVKLLITSRYHFQLALGSSAKIEVSASKSDIQMLVEEQIYSSSRLENLIKRSPQLKAEIITAVIDKSRGMFLIARFLMNWICELLTLREVRDALKSLPSGIAAMYHLTMDRIGGQKYKLKKLAMFALFWAFISKRRLRVGELLNVVAFEMQEGSEMVMDDDLYERDDILSACAGLIICVDDEVQFVHFSVQEFLSEHCHQYFPDATPRAMETCLRYLISLAPLIPANFAFQILSNRLNIYEEATVHYCHYPFADYASSHWGFHAFDAEGHERSNVQLVDQFFSHPISPYLVSSSFAYPRIRHTEAMSPFKYKTLFFAAFGLRSLMSRCINGESDPGGPYLELDLDVRDMNGRNPLFFAVAHNRSEMVKQLWENGLTDATSMHAQGNSPLHWAAAYDHSDIINTLLELGALIDTRDEYGETAIFTAVGRAKLGMVELLLEKGADLNVTNNTGYTLFRQAASLQRSDIATILITNGIDINSADGDGRTPVCIAAELGKWEIVKLLIEKGSDISVPCRGQTILHQAVYKGQPDIVAILLERGLDIDLLDKDGRTPIWIALEENGPEMVWLMIEKGADINATNGRGETLLHRAAYRGWSDIVNFLLVKGMDIDSLDGDEQSPIFSAVDGEQLSMVTLLIDKGADLSITCRGQTILHQAVCRGYSDIVAILLESGLDINLPDGEGQTPAWIALEESDWELVRLIIEKGADIYATNGRGETLFHRLAAYRRWSDIVTFLLVKGMDIDSLDGDERTPIFSAVDRKDLDTVTLLIEKGADLNIICRGQTVLHRAVYRGYSDIVAILLESGLDINLPDGEGQTPAWIAFEESDWELVRLIIEKGADINATNGRGETLLHRAAYRGWSDIVTFLLWKGMNISSLDGDGRTPIFSAVDGEQLGMVALLIEKGADLSMACRGQTILHRAVCRGYSDIVAILLESGLDINLPDGEGQTPAWIAFEESDWELVRLIIEKGADINATNGRGETLLHRAAYRGWSDIATFLLVKGMDIDSLDGDGRTPLFSAMDGGKVGMLKLLIQSGADTNISHRGQTILHKAVYKQHSDIVVVLLLEKGSDISSMDKEGRTPIEIALRGNDLEMVQLITLVNKEVGTNATNAKRETLLHQAAYCGSLSLAYVLLEEGVNIDSLDGAGRTPLFSAVNGGELRVMKLLIEKGADVKISSKSGETILQILHRNMLNGARRLSGNILELKHRWKEMLKMLLEEGADPIGSNHNGRNLLHSAAREGWSDISDILLENGIDIDSLDEIKCTPIFLAVEENHPEMVKLLINKGADISIPNRHGQTPLHRAAYLGHVAIAAILLKNYQWINIDPIDEIKRTPIFLAVEENHQKMVKLLVDEGADIGLSNGDGETPLHRAAYLGRVDIAITLLANFRVDIDLIDGHRRTPILLAVEGNHPEMVELLVDEGANISISTRDGQTLLHRAAYLGRVDIATTLLEHGVGINMLDENKCTPIFLAVEGNHPEMVKLLINKGADISIPNRDGQTPLQRAEYLFGLIWPPFCSTEG